MKSLEYIGGNIYALIGYDENGYETHILSVEVERGKIPFICSYVPSQVSKENLNTMLELIFEIQK